jgi:hypothetical protein
MDIQQAVQDTVVQAAKMVEEQVDTEIDRLEKMTSDEMEDLRERRLRQLKKEAQLKNEWLQKGHGSYSEIASEPDFFPETKDSPRVVCHFYRDSTFRCKIIDKHLALLAPKHVETKFVKINVEKCKFLCDRLSIKVLPTVVMVKDGKFVDRIVGFDELGGHDEFSTAMIEWRIARAEVINYSGDLSQPPDKPKATGATVLKKSIRGQPGDDDDDDDDY